MTDGIIQKVIAEWMHTYGIRKNHYQINVLESKLIEEIKKKRFDFGYYNTFDLIGDNA